MAIRDLNIYAQAHNGEITFYRDETNDILMPYNAGDYSTTYNSFIAAGYDENGTQDGVYLKDINQL